MKSKTKVNEPGQETDVQLTLKRKWQIALRRYVLESNPSINYAPYFGLPASNLREWVEIQFLPHMQWSNFGKAWNLTQRVPAQLFDLRKEGDLELCWNFVNISVQDLKVDATTASTELFATKQFFKKLYKATEFVKCKEIVDKLTDVESGSQKTGKQMEAYILKNMERITSFQELDSEDFARLNQGEEIEAILMEKEIIKKFGS